MQGVNFVHTSIRISRDQSRQCLNAGWGGYCCCLWCTTQKASVTSRPVWPVWTWKLSQTHLAQRLNSSKWRISAFASMLLFTSPSFVKHLNVYEIIITTMFFSASVSLFFLNWLISFKSRPISLSKYKFSHPFTLCLIDQTCLHHSDIVLSSLSFKNCQ